MKMTYKEIKRGNMICEIWEHSGTYTIKIVYKDETKTYGPYSDEDEATQMLTEKAESWIDELTGHFRNRSTSGMRMIGGSKK